tara:strand:+ start:111 stop:869 length:759 start_codon:yes stop_codon:yes gene_type:complete
MASIKQKSGDKKTKWRTANLKYFYTTFKQRVCIDQFDPITGEALPNEEENLAILNDNAPFHCMSLESFYRFWESAAKDGKNPRNSISREYLTDNQLDRIWLKIKAKYPNYSRPVKANVHMQYTLDDEGFGHIQRVAGPAPLPPDLDNIGLDLDALYLGDEQNFYDQSFISNIPLYQEEDEEKEDIQNQQQNEIEQNNRIIQDILFYDGGNVVDEDGNVIPQASPSPTPRQSRLQCPTNRRSGGRFSFDFPDN